MKTILASFKNLGGFTAGILVGLAMTIPVFLPTAPGTEHHQTILLFSSALLFVIGIGLRAVVTQASTRNRVEV